MNDIIEFDHNIESLNEIKAQLSTIDKTNIPEVESAIKNLVKIRRAIQAKGKTYREEAIAFNKKVIEKEKEYVGIIEPLEIELKKVLEDEEQRKVLEARKELLPNKKKQLSVLKIVQPQDEQILAMNEEQWITYYDQKFSEHEQNIENEIKKARADEERVQREEQIRKDAEKRAEEKAEKDAELKEIREKEAQQEKARQEEEARKKMESDKKYQNWLTENGYTEETKSDFVLEKVGNKVRLSKIIAIFSIEG